MKNDYKKVIEKEIARCNKNLLTLNIIITLVLALFISSFFSDLRLNWKILFLFFFFSIPAYNFYKLYGRYQDYKNHPIYKHIKELGNYDEVSKIIHDGLKKPLANHKDILLTDFGIIKRTMFDFIVIHSTHILWVYPIQTKHSVNFVPTGTTNKIRVYSYFTHYIDIEFSYSKDGSDRMMNLIHAIAPWAIYGFSEEIKSIFDRDRNQLIGAVEQNKKEIFTNKNGKKQKSKKI